MDEIRTILRAEVNNYKFSTVRLTRQEGNEEGSVGLIFTKTTNGRDSYITVGFFKYTILF